MTSACVAAKASWWVRKPHSRNGSATAHTASSTRARRRGLPDNAARRALPGQGVGWPAWIRAGGQHARLRIPARHHGADTARADLGQGVTERAQLSAGALGNPRLHVELTGPVYTRPERVHERLRREARSLDGLLGIHPPDEQ